MYVFSKENNWRNPYEDFSKIGKQEVYLPNGTKWIDFWTGETHNGGKTIVKDVPIDIIPLYVRAGSIVPFGPKVQYSTEKKWDNLEIRVYSGANGEFVLYEDEFDNYNYENGAYSEIPFSWNDSDGTLTIGARKGSFNGMLKNRKFTVKRVNGNSKTVTYKGKEIKVKI
jgi:alpha-D-xyloside xylohydrolase